MDKRLEETQQRLQELEKQAKETTSFLSRYEKKRKDKLNTPKAEEHIIRQILNDRDPILGSPEGEYDCLIHRLMTTLHKGIETTESISSLISRELTHHFGIKATKEKIDAVSKEIARWWSSRNQDRQL